MKIALVISTLRQGGAERVCSLLAQEFCDQGHDVLVVALGKQSKDFYSLDQRIGRVYFDLQKDSANIFHGIWSNFKRLFLLRKTIVKEKADCVISFMDHTNVLCALALIGWKGKLIGTEHTDPRKASPGKIWELLRKGAYPLFDKFVFPARGIREYFDWLPDSKCEVIPNPLPPVIAKENEVFEKGEKKWVMAAGRLFKPKGFDVLIRIFGELCDEFKDWNLMILGEGEERGALEKLIEERSLSSRVFLPGNVKDILAYFSKADLFVLASEYEGFGNVLAEALSCGVAAVAFDCPVGPREIIRSEEDGGILVPSGNVDALKETMRKLMKNDEERTKLASSAPKIHERMDLKKIAPHWIDIITSR